MKAEFDSRDDLQRLFEKNGINVHLVDEVAVDKSVSVYGCRGCGTLPSVDRVKKIVVAGRSKLQFYCSNPMCPRRYNLFDEKEFS